MPNEGRAHPFTWAPDRTKAQTCPSRFKKLVLQAWEAEVPGSRHRLLHEVGRSRTLRHYYREEHPCLRMEKHRMQVRNPEGACLRQWKTVR